MVSFLNRVSKITETPTIDSIHAAITDLRSIKKENFNVIVDIYKAFSSLSDHQELYKVSSAHAEIYKTAKEGLEEIGRLYTVIDPTTPHIFGNIDNNLLAQMYKSTGKIGEIEFRFSPSIDKLIYEKKIKEGKLDVNEAFASAAEKIKAGVNLLIMSADKINKIEEIHRFDKKLNMHDLAGRSGMFSGRLNDFAKSEKMTALSASFQGKTANQLVAV